MAFLFASNTGDFTDPNAFNLAFSGPRTGNWQTGYLSTTAYSMNSQAVNEGSSLEWKHLSAHDLAGFALNLSAVFDDTATLDVIISGNDGYIQEISYPLANFMKNSSYDQYWSNINYHVLLLDTPFAFSNVFNNKYVYGFKTSKRGAVAFYNTQNNITRYYITDTKVAPRASDVVYIAGIQTGTQMNSVDINYNNTAGNFLGGFSVCHGGNVTFNTNQNVELNLSGSYGITIGNGAKMTVGDSGWVNSSSTFTHTIRLRGGFMTIGDHAELDVYGASKKNSAYLVNAVKYSGMNSLSAKTAKVDTVENLNDSNWAVGDRLVIIPNEAYSTTEYVTIANFNNSNSFNLSNPINNDHHNYKDFPSIYNMTRNVKIITDRGGRYFRITNNAKVNLVNVEMNSVFPFQVLTRGSGYLNMDNCAISATYMSNNFLDFPTHFARPIGYSNITVKNCIHADPYESTNNMLVFNSVTADNIEFRNNSFIGGNIGLVMNDFYSRNAIFDNNYFIGSRSYGATITNTELTGSFGGNFNLNGDTGLQIYQNGSSIFNFRKIQASYNKGNGVEFISPPSALSATIIRGMSANNNRLTGINLSSYNTRYLQPYKLDIADLQSNDNYFAGFEAYNVWGSMSSCKFKNNYIHNMIVSVGNKPFVLDNITSTISTAPLYLTYTSNGSSYRLYPGDSPFGNSDGYIDFDGNRDRLTFSPYTSANFYLSANDFTIEGWFYPTRTSTTDQVIVTKSNGGTGPFYIGLNSGKLIAGFSTYINTAYDSVALNSGWNINHPIRGFQFGTPTMSAWNHFAFVRRGQKFGGFLNGVRRGYFSADEPLGSSMNDNIYVSVGGLNVNAGYFKGRISNLRIINGDSIYLPESTNITVPNKSFDLIDNTSMLLRFPYDLKYITSPPFENTSSIYFSGGRNYYPLTIKNSLLSSTSINPHLSASSPILLRNTTFENFSVDNSTLSSSSLIINAITNVHKIEGSYSFNNCKLNSRLIHPYLLSSYQSNVVLDSGINVMANNNSISNQSENYKFTAAGIKSADSTLGYSRNAISEKLEPFNPIIKLRSGSKLVPLNIDDGYRVSVFVRKSSSPSYVGAPPRLILRNNNIDTVLAVGTAPNGTWEQLIGIIQKSQDQSVVEVFVDCSANPNSGYINIDNWGLVKL